MDRTIRAPESKTRILWELFATFFKIGLFTFGGGYAMISIIQRETVEKLKWVTAEDIMNMIVIAESTPGVIAVNSATFVGYKVAGVRGGILATFGVVLPSFLIIILISLFYNQVKDNKFVAAAFRGIRCAVAVLIVSAVKKLAKQVDFKWYNIAAIIAVFAISSLTDFDVIYLILIGGAVGIAASLIVSTKEKKTASVADSSDETKIDSEYLNGSVNNDDNSVKSENISLNYDEDSENNSAESKNESSDLSEKSMFKKSKKSVASSEVNIDSSENKTNCVNNNEDSAKSENVYLDLNEDCTKEKKQNDEIHKKGGKK